LNASIKVIRNYRVDYDKIQLLSNYSPSWFCRNSEINLLEKVRIPIFLKPQQVYRSFLFVLYYCVQKGKVRK